MKLHSHGQWFIAIHAFHAYWVIAYERRRNRWYYNGVLPNRPWTHRFRIGCIEFERTKE